MKQIIAASALLVCAAIAVAQPGSSSTAPQNTTTPVALNLFAPELVMVNQERINLLPEQRTRIVSAMKDAQAKFTDLQWTLSAEEAKLYRLLEVAAPETQPVLEQMDRVLLLEHNMKRAQMTLLVEIKSTLTRSQQMELAMLSQPRTPGGGPAMGGGGAGGGMRGGRGGRPGGG